MAQELAGPKFVRYFGPTLQALVDLGGSGRAAEVVDKVAATLRLSEAELAETTTNGESRFRNQVAWARFYLAKFGCIDSSRRGVWSLTDRGRQTKLSPTEARQLFLKWVKVFRDERQKQKDAPTPSADQPAPQTGQPTSDSHREQLLSILLALPPSGFERLCQRLLREAGFIQVVVTGRSGDGGIDGYGTLQVNPLVSFKVLFQCKRYAKSVSPTQVRDFRGAMQGRADKGIILTTGTFTGEARREASRDGVPPIELVDGEKLLGMFEELELGVRPITAYEISEAFFDEFGRKGES